MKKAVMRSARLRQGSIYVVSSPNGYVKVGTSTKPFERFSMMQTSSPLILTLSYVCECTNHVDVEVAAHSEIAEFRRHREWFEVSVDRAIEVVRSALRAVGQDPSGAPPRPRRKVGVPVALQAGISETTAGLLD